MDENIIFLENNKKILKVKKEMLKATSRFLKENYKKRIKINLKKDSFFSLLNFNNFKLGTSGGGGSGK